MHAVNNWDLLANIILFRVWLSSQPSLARIMDTSPDEPYQERDTAKHEARSLETRNSTRPGENLFTPKFGRRARELAGFQDCANQGVD